MARHEEKSQSIAACLSQLEAELKLLSVWESLEPDVEALQSSQPFAVDTLEFHQWLQWIFIAKMQCLLQQRLPLPGACGMQPMVDDWASRKGKSAKQLNSILLALDDLLSSAP